MATAVRISLPADQANLLIEARLAVPARTTRGVGDVLEVVVSGIGVGANVVSILAAPEAIRQLVQRARGFRRRGEETTVITVAGPGIESRVEIDGALADEEVVDRVGAFLHEAVAAMVAASSDRAGQSDDSAPPAKAPDRGERGR